MCPVSLMFFICVLCLLNHLHFNVYLRIISLISTKKKYVNIVARIEFIGEINLERMRDLINTTQTSTTWETLTYNSV